MKPQPTEQMLDCLVSYFGLDEHELPTYQRYFCYQVVAGPGPTPGSGVASIRTLAIYDESQDLSRNIHTAATGGPLAALATAIRYLDALHERGHLRKVQSEVRGLAVDAIHAVPNTSSHFAQPSNGQVPTGKG